MVPERLKNNDKIISKWKRKVQRCKTPEEQAELLIRISDFEIVEKILPLLERSETVMFNLFRSVNEWKRCRITKLIDDQECLSQIARIEKSALVRSIALDKIKDRSLLYSVLQSENDITLILGFVRILRFDSEQNFQLLKPHFEKHELRRFLKEEARQDLLLKFLCDESNKELRMEMIPRMDLTKVPDVSRLTLLRLCKEPFLTRMILDSLDQETLTEIAKGGNRRINAEIENLAKEGNLLHLQQLASLGK